MSRENYYRSGYCLFCGQPATERFHSGTSETYENCDCEARAKWFMLKLELATAERNAEIRLEMLRLENIQRAAVSSVEMNTRRLVELNQQLNKSKKDV